MTLPLLVWLIWGLLGLAWELYDVFNTTPGDTLSEQVWRFLKLGSPPGGLTSVRRILFIALWGWLTFHFFFHFA